MHKQTTLIISSYRGVSDFWPRVWLSPQVPQHIPKHTPTPLHAKNSLLDSTLNTNKSYTSSAVFGRVINREKFHLVRVSVLSAHRSRSLFRCRRTRSLPFHVPCREEAISGLDAALPSAERERYVREDRWQDAVATAAVQRRIYIYHVTSCFRGGIYGVAIAPDRGGFSPLPYCSLAFPLY